MDHGEEFDKVFQTARILAIGMFASILFYAGVLFILIQAGVRIPFSGEILQTCRLVFLCVSIAGLIAVPFIKKIILQRRREGEDSGKVLDRLRTSSIVALAICEQPMLLGFILALGSYRWNDFFIFAFLAMVGFAKNIPRWQEWERVYQD